MKIDLKFSKNVTVESDKNQSSIIVYMQSFVQNFTFFFKFQDPITNSNLL